MQVIFNQTASPSRGVLIDPQWSYIRQGLNRNLNQVVAYYHNRTTTVKGNHFVVMLLNSLKTSMMQPIERYYEQVDASTTAISLSMGMSSALHGGTIFDGVFYGKGVREIIVSASEPIPDFQAAIDDWKNQSPIKPICHPKSDLDLHLPQGTSYSSQTGLAVITVNIPLLALMYYCFTAEQEENRRKGKNFAPASQFVHQYVLPNMLASHLDVAILNRISMMAAKKPLEKPVRAIPIAIADFTPQADKVFKEIVGFLSSKSLSLHDMFCTVPAVTAANGMEAMKLPVMAPTRPYQWVELAARIKYIGTMMVCSPTTVPLGDKGLLQNAMRTIINTGAAQEFERRMEKVDYDALETYKAVVAVLGQS